MEEISVPPRMICRLACSWPQSEYRTLKFVHVILARAPQESRNIHLGVNVLGHEKVRYRSLLFANLLIEPTSSTLSCYFPVLWRCIIVPSWNSCNCSMVTLTKTENDRLDEKVRPTGSWMNGAKVVPVLSHGLETHTTHYLPVDYNVTAVVLSSQITRIEASITCNRQDLQTAVYPIDLYHGISWPAILQSISHILGGIRHW